MAETWSAENRARSGFKKIASLKLQMKPKSKWSHFSIATLIGVKIKSERAWKNERRWKTISWLVCNPNSFAFMFAHMEWLAFCNETNQTFMLIDANFYCGWQLWSSIPSITTKNVDEIWDGWVGIFCFAWSFVGKKMHLKILMLKVLSLMELVIMFNYKSHHFPQSVIHTSRISSNFFHFPPYTPDLKKHLNLTLMAFKHIHVATIRRKQPFDSIVMSNFRQPDTPRLEQEKREREASFCIFSKHNVESWREVEK